MTRPSETVTAAVGSILGALFAILVAYGVDIPDGVQTAAVVLVAWIATGVTWFYARRQRAGALGSAPDGKVTT
jgi:hypothetical protein